uniref:Uncharacterized protein n=1 Tax=Oryza punctata TaxID=4537 RepID=A0A0E0M377_ORYPU
MAGHRQAQTADGGSRRGHKTTQGHRSAGGTTGAGAESIPTSATVPVLPAQYRGFSQNRPRRGARVFSPSRARPRTTTPAPADFPPRAVCVVVASSLPSASGPSLGRAAGTDSCCGPQAQANEQQPQPSPSLWTERCPLLHAAAGTSSSTSDGPNHSWCGGTVDFRICTLAPCHGLPNCCC